MLTKREPKVGEVRNYEILEATFQGIIINRDQAKVLKKSIGML